MKYHNETIIRPFKHLQNTKPMDPQPESFVSGALAVVLRLSRFAGIAPLQFEKKKTGWRVKVSSGLSIYGYFVVTIIILVTTGTLITELQMGQDKSVRMRTHTRRVVWIVDATLMMLISGTAVYGAPGQMRSMIACLNQLQKINFELNIHTWPSCAEKKKTALFFLCFTITVLITVVDHVLLITIYQLEAETLISVMYSLYYCCYWIMQLHEMLFIMMTLHVKHSLKGVNDGLTSLLHEIADSEKLPLLVFNNKLLKVIKKAKNPFISDNSINSITHSWKIYPDQLITKSSKLHHETVRRLALVYALVCEVVRDMDQSYGIILLMMLGSFLLHLVCTPYYLINNLFVSMSTEISLLKEINVAVQLCWCVYHMMTLLIIIEPCHLIHVEMENTRILVSHLMRCTQSVYDPLAVELEVFFKQLILNNTCYSPLKITTMSRALVATILGSITTYLVVIIQL